MTVLTKLEVICATRLLSHSVTMLCAAAEPEGIYSAEAIHGMGFQAGMRYAAKKIARECLSTLFGSSETDCLQALEALAARDDALFCHPAIIKQFCEELPQGDGGAKRNEAAWAQLEKLAALTYHPVAGRSRCNRTSRLTSAKCASALASSTP